MQDSVHRAHSEANANANGWSNLLNLSPIDKLGKKSLGFVDPGRSKYEPQGEHAGIHSNPEGGNCQAPSFRQNQLKYIVLTITGKSEGGEGTKALYKHEWHSKQTACSYTAGSQTREP